MCKRDRLCFLQVGKSRHISLNIFFHNAKQCLKKFFQQFVDLPDLISCIKLHIQCNLVIAAASGVQLFAGIADAVDQICLHKAVDIFVFVCDLKCSVLNITQNAIQAFQDLITLSLSQNALCCQHFHMCLASCDILFVKFLIKRYGCIKIINQLIGLFGETSTP